MGTLDNVLKIRKALETLLKTPGDIPSDASVHIQELDTIKMNLKLLQKSKIGFTLDKIRKATDDASVKKSAKSLIKKWQKLDVPAEKSKESSKNNGSSDEENKSPNDRLIPIDFKLTAPVPTKDKKGRLVFEDHPEFSPNLTPQEVLHMGSFGGTYFRPIYSSVTKQKYGKEVWQELPSDWLKGLDIRTRVSSSLYDASRNKYKVRDWSLHVSLILMSCIHQVKCGASLEEWENSGWMNKQDPYGWFQWYCRYTKRKKTKSINS